MPVVSELELVASWDAWMVAAGRPKTTRDLRGAQLRRFLRDVPDPWSASTGDLVGWLATHRWAAETRRSHRAMLTTFYAWATLTGRTSSSPAALLPRVRPAEPRPRPAPVDAVELAIAGADDRVRLMVELAARQGLRRGEISRVHRDDVQRDLVGWSILVHGKGGRDRVIPLHDDLAFRVRRHADPTSGWLFAGAVDGHLSPRRVGDLVAAALPPPWTCHTLRHYFATRTWQATRDLFVTQQLLGHQRPETTQRYVQVAGEHLRAGLAWAAAG